MSNPVLARAQSFSDAYGLSVPILMAPMAGACPPELAAAVANAGGMGACGTLLMSPDAIEQWVARFRSTSNGSFQLNVWIPDPPAKRDPAHEAEVRAFLATWGPEVPEAAGDKPVPDFEAQCAAMLAAGPQVISSIMGLYPPDVVAAMKARDIKWFATVTNVRDAVAAEAAGADVIVAQGLEAGGHRGAFDADDAEAQGTGLFALVPAIADAVSIPVVATGGIGDARGLAAALLLGASAVQVGTAFLRSPEAAIAPGWANALAEAGPDDTMATRAFSGRLGRSLKTEYVVAAAAPGAPKPVPYPVQRALSQGMRDAAVSSDDVSRMQAWAGQAARLATDQPAGEIVAEMWDGARLLLQG